jgi:phosphoribosylformimino-5-aminoimidazole carboxamide ribotide isomerase
MTILPAIDILDGQVVRLRQGDFTRPTVYAPDPVLTAQRWTEAGARWLHVVDLDGARAGSPRHLDLLAAIARSVTAHVQFGGGLRSVEAVHAALEAGAARVVVGTAAVTDPAMLASVCDRFGAHVVVGLDVRDEIVRIRAWTKSAGLDVQQAVRRVLAAGARRLVVTDVSADGEMTGPNLGLYRRVVPLGVPVIASGGVRSTEDLCALRELGVEGVIVGRALYEGAIDFRAAERGVRTAE